MDRNLARECIVDTNILVYETIIDSEYHEKVNETLSKIDRVYVTVQTLLELSLVLKKLGIKDDLIVERLWEIILDDRYIVLDLTPDEISKALSILESEDKDVRDLIDKTLIAKSMKLDIPLYTFDEKLRRQCKKNGVKTIE